MLSFVDMFLNAPYWMFLCVMVVILLYLYGTQPFGIWKGLGVSTPKPYPFLGNTPEMFDDRIGFRAAVSKWQKLYGRIFGIYFFRKPTLIITDPEAMKQVLMKEFNNFTDRFFVCNDDLKLRIIKKGLFFENGADWKRIRRIISPTFSIGKLKLLTHCMNLTAQRLAQNLRQFAVDKKMVEAKKTFGGFTLDVICGTAFGLDINSQCTLEGPFIQHATNMMIFPKVLQLILASAGAFPAIGSLYKILGISFFSRNDVKFFENNLSAIIKERKSQPQRKKNLDFLQLLIEAEDEEDDDFVGDKKLTTEEVAAQGILFIIAGYETTSTTLQYLSYELAKNQDVQTKLVEEIQEVLGDNLEPDYNKCQNLKYMEATINETLRMYPPVHFLSRVAEKTTSIQGVPVPAGSAIIIPVANICRDPEFFPDPDSFKPERFLNKRKQDINPLTFLPFGYGPRLCIGMRLAMLELKIALVHMLRSVRFVSATPEELDIEDYTGILIPRIPIKLFVQEVK